MATNSYGFIQKRYRQPIRYENIFNNWCAIYRTNSGKEIMIEAKTDYWAARQGCAGIEHYDILMRHPTHRSTIIEKIPSQKKAIELIEKFIERF